MVRLIPAAATACAVGILAFGTVEAQTGGPPAEQPAANPRVPSVIAPRGQTNGQANAGQPQATPAPPRQTDLSAIYPRAGDSAERGRAIAVGAYSMGPSGACFTCHGIDGKGDPAAVFPRLADQSFKYLYDSLKGYATGARQSPIMGPIAKALNDQQMRDAAAYYASQAGAPYGMGPTKVDPSVLQNGGALAAVGSAERGIQGCVNCHGPDGVGLPPSYPFLAGQYADYIESQLKMWQSGQRRDVTDDLGIMEGIAKRMTPEEMHAVAVYYASMRPQSVTPERSAAATRPGPVPVAPSGAAPTPPQPNR